jgi:hypothetical protein
MNWMTGQLRFNPWQRQTIFPLASVSRPAPCPGPPCTGGAMDTEGVLSRGVKRGQAMTLTTHPYLVLRSRTNRSYTPLPSSASMACSWTALLYLYSVETRLRTLSFYRGPLMDSDAWRNLVQCWTESDKWKEMKMESGNVYVKIK